jgi:hypothetical protein
MSKTQEKKRENNEFHFGLQKKNVKEYVNTCTQITFFYKNLYLTTVQIKTYVSDKIALIPSSKCLD